MIQEILDLGFQNIELGHGIRLTLVEGILKMWEAGKVNITSLHNFCPLPAEIPRASPDCYQLSSHLDGERERAVRHSYKTIDFAKRLGAKFVVMHLGSVPIDDYTGKLVQLAEAGLHNSRQFVDMRIEALRKREAKQDKPFFRMIDCLRQVVDYAGERGIQLGIESRHSFEEIPSEREMLDVLARMNPEVVGYWHDFGHAQIKHNLGFLDHAQWLAKAGPLALGCHVHDVRWPFRDHSPPFSGEIEYKKLRPLLPEKCQMVLELSPRAKREEVEAARDRWLAEFPGDGFP